MDSDERIAATTAGSDSGSGSGNPAPLPPLAPPPSFIPLFTSPSPRRPLPPPLPNGHTPLPLPATPSSSSSSADDSHKKQKTTTPSAAAAKKPKKKSASVWSTTTRKTKKKPKPTPSPLLPTSTPAADRVLITPVPKPPSLTDDSPSAPILLSRVYKADKVDLSDDRLTAGSTLGFRMVRATRGVTTGAYYFEIRILAMGESGHARLGWTTDKGDLQAPVGFDANSFGYRDVDGTKVHKAMREDFGGEGFGEGDVIGFYINLPDGDMYAPKPPQLVFYKGQKFMVAPDAKDDPPKVIPGSEMSFFKNGVCQGVAFTNLFGGRYYPAASMYTLPNQPNCEVRFNFGPDFEFFPEDFGGRPTPRPMIEVPYLNQDIDGRVDVPTENGHHTEEASSSSVFRSASMRA